MGLLALLATAVFIGSVFGGESVSETPSTGLDFDYRIVGGSPARIEDFPWIVSLQRYAVHRCGASIISANRVLTAAHCVRGISARTLAVRAGSIYTQSGGQVAKVSKVIAHPSYDPNTLVNDIAILRLWTRLNVVPAGVSVVPTLGNSQEVRDGAEAFVAGWGYLIENGNVDAPSLRAVGVPIVGQEECKRLVGGFQDGMLCAGFLAGGRDACQVDSGGPLTVDGVLVGIVSWGNGCARASRPGVYTNVGSFRQWIDQNV